jgi:hypothetical protein
MKRETRLTLPFVQTFAAVLFALHCAGAGPAQPNGESAPASPDVAVQPDAPPTPETSRTPGQAWSELPATPLGDDELLRVESYVAPYPGFHDVVSLRVDGLAARWREVPDWAHQDSWAATLTAEELAQVQQSLDALAPGSLPAGPLAEGQRVTRARWRRQGVETSAGYLGDLPGDLAAVVDSLRMKILGANGLAAP